MEIGHIVSTMDNQNIDRLIKKMKLATRSIIVNQTNKFTFDSLTVDNLRHDVYSFNERGVGLSRNNGLMRSNFDVTIMSDDDMEYIESYEKIISNAYRKHPDADMIVFNVKIHEKNAVRMPVKKNGRVHIFNCLRYGTVTFTFKTESVRNKKIYFSLLFGGGSRYSGGEDTIFIWDCIKSGLKVYSIDTVIANVYNDDSTWFKGYTDEYFIDRGALFGELSKRWAKLLCLQFALRKRKLFKDRKNWMEAYRLMVNGIMEIC